MADHKSLSFTATLLVNGHPLATLDEATEGTLCVNHPDPNLGSMDVSQALGILSTPDEAWDAAREAGLVDFHVTGEVTPTLFYFRHTDEGYRLYIRGGEHDGQGVFKSKYGAAMVSPIEHSDPSPWLIQVAHTQTIVTLEDLETGAAIINLKCPSSGKTLSSNPIADGEGCYLITRGSAPATRLRLNIFEREVDWARR